jgi:hypothetical protein
VTTSRSGRHVDEVASSAQEDSVEYQLRHFRIRAGSMDAFVDAWLAGVYPLRRKFGFRFVGAWRIEDADEFVWIIGYDGADGFAAADKRYYDSDERKRIRPDPAQYIEAPVKKMMRSVLPA